MEHGNKKTGIFVGLGIIGISFLFSMTDYLFA